MKISRRLRDAVKTSDRRQYKLARQIGVHPSLLSQWINDIVPVRGDDSRILKLATVLDVPASECFE